MDAIVYAACSKPHAPLVRPPVRGRNIEASDVHRLSAGS
jgi:hypothetical protein